MDMKIYEEILNQTENTTLWLLLYFQGEPFLHPVIFSMIKKAKEKKLYTTLSTNGHFLNETNCTKIIDSGLNRIIISLDGTDAETYSKYRKNGDFNKVLDGINTLTREKKRMNSHNPFVILQFLVFRHNQNQVKPIKKLGKTLGVNRVHIKSAQIYNFNEKTATIPTKAKYSRYVLNSQNQSQLKSKLKNSCRRLWFSSVITTDGDILPCCFDKHADHPMGNITQQLFSAIWKNNLYNNFRKKVLTNRGGIGICRNCTE